MNPRRLAQGEKRARRVLRIWRASSTCFNRVVDAVQYADDGPQFRTMRYTRVPCSCLYCGNPRRHFGQVTRQEQQADDRMRAELRDAFRPGGNGETCFPPQDAVVISAEGGTG